MIGVDLLAASALMLSGQPLSGLAPVPFGFAVRGADRSDGVVRVVEPTYLRATRGGRVVARVGTRTSFGSARVLPIVRRRDRWLAVIAAERGNGKLGWLPTSRVRPVRLHVRLRVDLSKRTLRATRAGRVVLRMPVGVGAPGTPTPTGRFAVTDRLPGFGPYGCCILALSARQPQLADSWSGGDRIAIHGTAAPASIGAAVTNGCLRASERDLRRLVKLARPGTRVLITR